MKKFLVVACALLILLPGAVQGDNNATWWCNLADLGGGLYSYTFTVTNLGPDKDAIFKIQIAADVPKEWATLSWTIPTGWDAKKTGGGLDLSTSNGDIGSSPPHGYYRIYGQSGAPAPLPGWTTQDFIWTVNKNTGPTPTVAVFTEDDVVYHLQTIVENWQNDGPSYTVHPTPEPSSLAVLAMSALPLGLAAWRRRRGN